MASLYNTVVKKPAVNLRYVMNKLILTLLLCATLSACTRPENVSAADNKALCDPKTGAAFLVTPAVGFTSFVQRNQSMEMMAVIQALCALKRPCQVILYTDSKYVQQGISSWINGWKAPWMAYRSWPAGQER